jgi:hypothetical protein
MAPKQRKAVKPMVGQDKETILRVEPYNLFGKHILRPYADAGLPIFLPKGVASEKKFWTSPKVLARADAEHSELCRRLQKGMSMTASTIQEFAEFSVANSGDALKAVQNLMDALGTAEGQQFVEACVFFNQQNETKRDLDQSKKHVDVMFKFFEKNKEDLEKKLRKAAMVSSRLYLASTSMFELLALTTNVKEWAKKIEPKKQQPKATRAWLDEPKSISKAKTALSKTIVDVPENKKRTNQKVVLKDDSNDSSDSSSGEKRQRDKKGKGDSSSGSENPSDDSDKKKQTKKNRMKEAGRKRKINSDSDSSGDEKVKDEKKKKKGKDKKKAKQLSSSSNDSDKKEKKAKKDTKEKKGSKASPSSECSKKDDEAMAMALAKSLLEKEKKAEKDMQEKKRSRASSSPECSKKEDEAKAMALAKSLLEKEKKAEKDMQEKKGSKASPSSECSKKDDEAMAMALAKSLLEKEKKAEKDMQGKKRSRASSSPECSKKEDEAKAMAIAMSCWSLGRVQELLAEAEQIKHGLGNLAGGVFPADKLQGLQDKIPKGILLLSPNLVLPMAAEDAPQEIENDIAKIFVNHVVRTAEEAEKYFSVQAGVPSGSSK